MLWFFEMAGRVDAAVVAAAAAAVDVSADPSDTVTLLGLLGLKEWATIFSAVAAVVTLFIRVDRKINEKAGRAQCDACRKELDAELRMKADEKNVGTLTQSVNELEKTTAVLRTNVENISRRLDERFDQQSSLISQLSNQITELGRLIRHRDD